MICTEAGDCTYTPETGFTGNDSFDYTVSDGSGGTASATVNVTVEAVGVNLPPQPTDDVVSTVQDTPVTFNVLANDIDQKR